MRAYAIARQASCRTSNMLDCSVTPAATGEPAQEAAAGCGREKRHCLLWHCWLCHRSGLCGVGAHVEQSADSGNAEQPEAMQGCPRSAEIGAASVPVLLWYAVLQTHLGSHRTPLERGARSSTCHSHRDCVRISAGLPCPCVRVRANSLWRELGHARPGQLHSTPFNGGRLVQRQPGAHLHALHPDPTLTPTPLRQSSTQSAGRWRGQAPPRRPMPCSAQRGAWRRARR